MVQLPSTGDRHRVGQPDELRLASEHPHGSEPNSRRQLLWLLLIVVLGAALRAFRLGQQSLWTDEVLTALSSSGSMRWVLTQEVVNTNIPPLYYVVVHLFLAFGRDERVIRLASVLSGAASVLLLYAVVRKSLGSLPATASAALLAISPFHIWYSQEARPYALLLLLSLLSLWLLQQAIAHPEDRRTRVGFVLSTASTFYCHTVGLAFIAFLAVYALVLTPRHLRRSWITTIAWIGVLLLPAAYRLITLAPNAYADPNREFNPVFVLYAFWAFATGYSIGPTLTQLHLPGRLQVAVHALPLIAPIAILFAALLALGARSLWRRSRQTLALVAAWLFFPLGFAIVGALLTRHPFNVRYAILSLPPFVVLVASGSIAPRRTLLRVGAAAALLLVSGFALRNYFFNSAYFREDNRVAGSYLASEALAGDLVVADAPYTAVNLQYYARRPDIDIVGYPWRSAASIPKVEPIGAPVAAITQVVTPSTSLDDVLRGRDRFWLFLSRTYHGAPASEVLAYCDARFRRVRQLATENDVQLVLYER